MFYYTETSKQLIQNRVDAFLHKDPCQFYFHDKEFSKIDWVIEPKESLQELYKQKAEQLRQKYDYLILAYSGGHDSSNILETFYYNNIHIDEIVLVGAFSQDSYSNSDENHNKEIYDAAIPILKKLNLTNTKINLIDYTKYFNNLNNFSIIKNYGSDWMKYIGSYMSVHNIFWNDVDNFLTIDKNKTNAIIFGVEKPNLLYNQQLNNFYTYFEDKSLVSYGNIQNKDYFVKENFYTSINSINVMKKQLHSIKNVFIQKCLIEKIISKEQFFQNYTNIIHKIIYSLKNPINHISPKSKTPIFSLRDQYLLNNKNSDMYNIYVDGIKKIPLNIANTPFITRRYYL